MTHYPLSRRQFLRRVLVIGGGAAALGGTGFDPLARLARADEVHPDAPARHYVFCYFSGGWDVLLGLDPRDPRDFNNTNMTETLIQPAFELLDGTPDLIETPAGITFGPYIGELADHADKLAVVRGMSMETLTHEVGRRRFLTAKVPSGLLARGSSSATWLASQLGESDPIPNLALRVESYNVDQPVYASGLVVSSVADLVRTLRPGAPAVGDLEARQLDELLSQVAGCEGARQSAVWQQAELSRLRAADMVTQELDRLFDFTSNTPEMEALRDHYGFGASTAQLATPEAHAAMAAQAIMGGVSRCVSIEASSGLDTHYDDWETDQGPRQQRGFNAVARLLDDLSAHEYENTGKSWLEHTVVVGFSEFSRTPLLNARGGRDHALMNACFLAGGAIRGGRVLGRSSDVGMAPTLVNLATGEPDPSGELVLPEHIVRALFDEVGISEEGPDLRVSGLDALIG